MKISIKVKTGARKEEVVKIDEKNYLITVKERPIKGKANDAVIKAISKYFDIPKSRVIIISGLNNSNKIIEILLQ